MLKFITSLLLVTLCLFANISTAQRITYSEPVANDDRDINFEIIGKIKSNILIFKNIRFKYAVSVYNDSMILKQKIDLDFIEGKTFNVDFITYQDFFYLIYQYQKKRIVHCMAVKLDAEGKVLGNPIQLDSTQIGVFAGNKIYNVVNSEDKKFISIFKIQKKNEKYNFSTLLFDENLKQINKADYVLSLNDNKDTYNNFSVDNAGNFVFTKSSAAGNTDNASVFGIYIKPKNADTLIKHMIDLNKNYLDEVKLKVDNINKHYIVNSLYYKQKRGSVDGLFSLIWGQNEDSAIAKNFSHLDDEIRAEAKKNASSRTAFDDFFIKNIIVKKDGGYIVISEDYYAMNQNNNTPWNR